MLDVVKPSVAAQTVAQQFHGDPAVQQALQTLVERMKFHQEKITVPRECSPESTESYQSMVDEFSSLRGGKLFFPYLGSGIGNGALVELADGSVKYDFINFSLFVGPSRGCMGSSLQ